MLSYNKCLAYVQDCKMHVYPLYIIIFVKLLKGIRMRKNINKRQFILSILYMNINNNYLLNVI